MTYNYTDKFRAVLELSYQEAIANGIKNITPDILTWGILKEGTNVGASFLTNKGLSRDELLQQYDEYIQSISQEVTTEATINPIFDPDALLTIAIAAKVCLIRKELAISPLHIILGVLLNKKDNILKKIFMDKNIIVEELETLKQQINTENILIEITRSGYNPRELDDNEEDQEAQHNGHYGISNDKTTDNLAKDLYRSKKKNATKDNHSDTPFLDAFGRDITAEAEKGLLDPVVGRQKEIERIIQILSRRKKSNPILVGDPGVGKTSIIEGLAQRIVERKVSRLIDGKKIISLDIGSLVAGTKFRGQFEERLKSIVKELEKNKNIILFIDEIHTIIGSGNTQGSLDMANMLKPALSKGEIQCIGTTTIEEYRKTIEKDGALDRRFQKVIVEQNTKEETLDILKNIKIKYEDHHNVIYTDEALVAIVDLADRYINDRFFPDKAIDILDEAAASVHIHTSDIPEELLKLEKELEDIKQKKLEAINEQKFELATCYKSQEDELTERISSVKNNWETSLKNNRTEITPQVVEQIVSKISQIPVEKVSMAETKRLKEMYQTLSDKVIGQDDAIKKVTKAIQRSRLGLRDLSKPIGTFLFLGPTGVGKTEMAKQLSEFLFGTTDAMIRIDMSEYMEKFAVSRLVGAPPGYVGYEEGGQLTERVRRKPYAVVLFDEIEKAHPDVYNILLQVMDEGFITDSEGRKVDFRHTLIIITSNIGSRQLKEFGQGLGFYDDSDMVSRKHHILTKALEKSFSPEFINRLDEIVEFGSLSHQDIRKIIDIEIAKMQKQYTIAGYDLSVSEKARDIIAELGYNKNYGARPLKRALQREIDDRVSDYIIEYGLDKGAKLQLDINQEKELVLSLS